MGNPRITEELEATSQAVLSADHAQVQESIGRVRWVRSGLLRRLIREERSPARPAPATEPHGGRYEWAPANVDAPR